MPAPRFVHLRMHSEFSIADGIVRVEEAVKKAAADGMPALAITDASNLFGAIKFFEAARAAGVQPVIGCDVWITNERNRDSAYRVTLICRNQPGYLALCEILSRAHAENHWRGRAEVRREWLRGLQGLIVLSGAEAGGFEVPQRMWCRSHHPRCHQMRLQCVLLLRSAFAGWEPAGQSHRRYVRDGG